MDIPLCQSEHKPQLLLNDPAAISLYHTAPEQFAGALAPNAELCDAWAEELAPLPVGLALKCPPEPDAEHCERPITMHYIEQCKEVFRPLLHDDAAFYYLHGAPTFPALRAAVLALGWIGYQAGAAAQTVATLNGIKALVVLTPAIFILGSWIAFRFVWNITPEVRTKMAAFKAGNQNSAAE